MDLPLTQVEAIGEQLVVMLKILRDAFGSRKGTILLGEAAQDFMIKPKMVEKRAWRYVILSPGDEKFGNLEVQLDWAKITAPYTSWSTSEKGVESFSEMHGRDDAYRILIEGTVKGFILIDYTMQIIEGVNKILPLLKTRPGLEDSLTIWKSEALSSIKTFMLEQEIVALEVLDYKIIDRKTQI